MSPQVIPFSALKDFLLNGKGREQGTFLPTDADVDALIAVLEKGLEAKHMADGALGADQLEDEAVTADKLADEAIETAKIADEAVTGPKIDSGALKYLVFTGMDGSVTPGACTLTGAAVGDVVVGIVNLTDAASASASFEATISEVNKIHQSASSNLSTKKFSVLLISGA
jgi:hypothetical protein